MTPLFGNAKVIINSEFAKKNYLRVNIEGHAAVAMEFLLRFKDL